MRRRTLLVGAGAALLARSALAQANDPARRVGFLSYGSGDTRELATIHYFEQRLAELGWTVGETVDVTYRFPAADVGRMEQYAEELVALSPEAIVCIGTPAARALKSATTIIPVIFFSNTDPVGSGLVDSLAHPGANVTGFEGFEYSLAGKWVELLLRIAPHMRAVGFVYDPDTLPSFERYLAVGSDVAAVHSLEFADLPVTSPEQLEPIFASHKWGWGLVFPPDTFTSAHFGTIVELAARYRLPAIYAFSDFPQMGGLMAYSFDRTVLAAQAAEYVDRILRGARVGDLPVQAPRRFVLAINLKTAGAMRLTVPPDLLAEATEVIE